MSIQFQPWSFRAQLTDLAIFGTIVIILQALTISWLIVSRRRRKRLSQELEARLQFERLVSELSVSFINLAPEKLEQKIGFALEKVRVAMDLDRCLLFEHLERQPGPTVTHRVNSPAAPLWEHPGGMLPFFFSRLSAGKMIFLENAEQDLPPEAEVERRYVTRNSIQSLLVVPVRTGPHGLHALACHTTVKPRRWPEEIVLRVQIVGEILISAIAATRAESALVESEQRYREVVESQAELVCRYLPDSTLTFVNEAYCRFFERTRESLIGSRFVELIPENVRNDALQQIQKMLRNKRSETMEHEVTLPDGRVGWQQWVDIPIPGPDGEVVEFQGIGRDITSRKEAEDAVLEREERFNLAAEATNMALWVINHASNEAWLSEQGYDLFGVNGDQPPTLEWFLSRVHADDRTYVGAALERALSSNHTFEIEYRLAPAPSGAARWLFSRGRGLRDARGQLVELLGVTLDITERKLNEQKLRAEQQEMAHISRLAIVGELTASIAHEINQPLGAILSNAEAAEIMLANRDPQIEAVREILADIRRDDLRASDVVMRLRALLQKRRVKLSPLDLGQLMAEVFRLTAAEARRRSVELLTDVAPDLPPIEGDKLHIQQVLLNLMVNAMDAMEDTSVNQRRIAVLVHPGANRGVTFSVEDRGHGISPERLPHLFESFFTTKDAGVGLGLSIARSIIEIHGGAIWAENNPEGGATFRFSLPGRAAV